jgi:hypothetical protein
VGMARHVSQADRALSDALAARDVDANARKIESMRQAGMLEDTNHPGLGRGRGSRSVRSPDEVDRAQYMAGLLDECGSYADAVLVAFVRDDYPIATDRLARAYKKSLGAVAKWIEKRGGPATSRVDIAGNVAVNVGKYFAKERRFRPLRTRAKHLGLVDRQTPMRRVMHDVATDLVAILIVWGAEAGLTTLTNQAAGTLQHLVSTDAVSGAHSTPPGAAPVSASITELAVQLSLVDSIRRVWASSIHELESARDAAKTFRAFAQAFGPYAKRRFGTGGAFAWLVASRANDRTVAYAIPGFVWLHRRHGQTLDVLIAFMAEWTPFFTAVTTILDQLPTEFQVIARPDGYSSLTPAQQHDLAKHLAEIETAYPHALETIRNPPPAGTHLG